MIRTAKLPDGSYQVDLRGWMCPYPKYMLEPLLKRLPDSGWRLAILVDCPSAATDVPELARRRGHTVSEIRQVAEGEWRLVIEAAGGTAAAKLPQEGTA